MGSKAPIVPTPSEDSPVEESHFGRSVSPKASAKNQLLERIADALQVAPAVFYNPPNAITPTGVAGGPGTTAIELEQECDALSHAYRRIHDPEMRLRLLGLVQAAAEQD